MKLGYISRRQCEDGNMCFKFLESPFTRTINSRSDTIKTKILMSRYDYDELVSNTEILKNNETLILVGEPFILDDELRERCERWVEFANTHPDELKSPFESEGS